MSLADQYRREIAAGHRDAADLAAAEWSDRDRGGWEARLRAAAQARGVGYDPSDLEGVVRNMSYAGNAGVDPERWLRNAEENYAQRASNVPGQDSYVDSRTPAGQALLAQRQQAAGSLGTLGALTGLRPQAAPRPSRWSTARRPVGSY